MWSSTQSPLLPMIPPISYSDCLFWVKSPSCHTNQVRAESQVFLTQFRGQSVNITVVVLYPYLSPVACIKRREKPACGLVPMSSLWVGWGRGGLGHSPSMGCGVMEEPYSGKHFLPIRFLLLPQCIHPGGFDNPSIQLSQPLDRIRQDQVKPKCPQFSISPL